MTSGAKIFIFPVEDLERAKSLFGVLLGASPSVDTPYYVQFDVGDQHIGLDPNGHSRGYSGAVGYWEVEDVNTRLQELLAAGAVENEGPKDVANGTLVASVKDADGNVIGLIQPS